MEGGCHTAYTDNHYTSDVFSVICEEFYYSVYIAILYTNLRPEITQHKIVINRLSKRQR